MKYIEESDAIEQYEDMLDECNGEFMGYQASRILRELDPIAYRVGFNDWLDSEKPTTEESEEDDSPSFMRNGDLPAWDDLH